MIKVIYEKDNSRSAAYNGQDNIGECTYVDTNGIWIIDHTFVEKEYGGQGIASKLVEEIVNQARIQGKLIYPLCPFAKREFENKSEYSDILKK